MAVLLISGISLISISLLGKEEVIKVQESKKTITFAVYGDAEQRRIISETVKYFERENNCEVDIYSFSSLESLQTIVVSQYSAGEPFDIFYADQQSLQQLKKKLEPLDDILLEIQSEGDTFIEVALQEGKVFGAQYALPTGVRPYCIYYNKVKLNWKGQQTPQEFMDNKAWNLRNFDLYCRFIYSKTQQPVFAISPEWQSFYSFIIGNGGKIMGFNENNKLILDEKGIEALSVLTALIKSGVVLYSNELQWGSDSLSLFRSEAVPMVVGPIDYIYELSKPIGFEWDVVPMPMIGSNFSSTVIEVPQIAVAKSNNAEISKKFVRFFVSSFGQKIRLEQGERLFSSLNMVFYTSFGDVHFPAHSNYLFFMSENGKTQPVLNSYTKNRSVILDNYHKLISGKMDLEDFAIINK